MNYKLQRISKKIKLKDVAEYVQCSNSTISRFENEEEYPISEEKRERYKNYIENYEEIKEREKEK